MTGFKPNGAAYAPTGVTVNGALARNSPNVQLAQLQHDPLSTANYLYLGDSDCSATKKGSTILRGDHGNPMFSSNFNSIHLGDKYVTFDQVGATSAIFTLEWDVN